MPMAVDLLMIFVVIPGCILYGAYKDAQEGG